MKKSTFEGLHTLITLYQDILGKKIHPSYCDQIAQWEKGTFNIVVIGEIKKGKSSFINAVLDAKHLVPIGSDIATSTVFHISYGEEAAYHVHFTKEADKSSISVTAEELAEYGTEKKNPGNKHHVEYIEVLYPSELLKSGITITDTPGLGALFRGHKLATYRQIPTADAVFYICDSTTAPIGRLDLEYMQDILKMTPNMYLIQTKIDSVESEIADARQAENKATISKKMKVPESSIPYFMTDAASYFQGQEKQKQRLIDDSGYPLLRRFLTEELIPAKDKLLEQRMRAYILPYVMELEEAILNKKRILKADTEEERKKLKEELEAAKQELEHWQNVEFPKLKTTVATAMRTIQRQSHKKCEKLRPSGLIQGTYEQIIQAQTTIEQLINTEREIGERLSGEAQTYYQKILKDVNKQICDLLQGISHELIDGAELPSWTDQDLDFTEDIDRLIAKGKTMRHRNSGFDKIRNVASGAGIGATVGGVLGGLVGSVILPGGGTIAGGELGAQIGLALGPILGGHMAYQNVKHNDFEQMRNNLIQTLSACFAQLMPMISTATQNFVTDSQIAVNDALTAWATTRKRNLEVQIEQVVQRGRAKEAELKAIALKLAEEEKKLTALCLCMKLNLPHTD